MAMDSVEPGPVEAPVRRQPPTDQHGAARRGLILGSLGVIAFSGTLIAARSADPAFGAVTVGIGRAVIAGVLAICVLAVRRVPLLPSAVDAWRVASVGVTAVLAFPLLTAVALNDVTAAHAAVVVGLAPIATAGFAVMLAGERPRARYWFALLVGVISVVAFAVAQGAGRPRQPDILVLLAVVLVGYGYAQGGVLSRRHDGGTVICWALIMSLPVTVPWAALDLVRRPPHHITWGTALGLGYVAVLSMFLGFFWWYRGLALGGVARVGRLQVLQPLLTLAGAAVFLGEHLNTGGIIAAVFVLASVALGRSAHTPRPRPAADR